tara:strand:+ start:971 stop:2047 length:1077 start_codon:yes stop_codon:yes gene_type:complete
MRKIGVLTFHGVLNHGAVLQAYALQKFFRNNGANAELVNYSPKYFTWQTYRPAKGIFKSFLKYSRLLKFKKFENNHLSVSAERYVTVKDLYNIKYDALVCGSDQVWNKSITAGSIDGAYLLNFPFDGERYAYAASAGANNVLDDAHVHDALKLFSGIGVREEYLYAELLSGELEAKHVADPTFLLDADEYDEIVYSKLIPKFPYIVSYEVSTDETRAEYQKAILKLKAKLDLPIVHIGDKSLGCADVNLLNISTNDWIALLKGANFVVTNSFHGCSFGIKFKKPLVVLSHLDKERNARPISLLTSVGMLECFFIVDGCELDKVSIPNLYLERDYQLYDKFVNRSRCFAMSIVRPENES